MGDDLLSSDDPIYLCDTLDESPIAKPTQSYLHGPDGKLLTEIPIRFLVPFRVHKTYAEKFVAQLRAISDEIIEELKEREQKLAKIDQQLNSVEEELHDLSIELRQVKYDLKPRPGLVINNSNELKDTAKQLNDSIDSYRESVFILETEYEDVLEEGMDLLKNELNCEKGNLWR